MKERIILAPGLNGNELLKNLALYGVNCFNTRILSATELAKLSLMRSGITVEEEFIDFNEELGIIAEVVKGSSYFKKTSYTDLRNITSAIRKMRSFVQDPDEAKILKDKLSGGVFVEKNNALLSIYDGYMQTIKERNLIDQVLLIRKATAESISIDADFVVLEECLPDPLAEALIQKLSGGSFSKISIRSLFDVTDKTLKIADIKNCYGATNEVETIISDIYSDKKLDNCIVAITDTDTYSQLFLDYSLLYDIPVTFGCGVPIINAYPAKLLSLYYQWMTTGFYGAEAVKQMLLSGYFNMHLLKKSFPEQDDEFNWHVFYDCLGEIRFTRDSAGNKARVEAFKKALTEDSKYIVEGESKEYKEFVDKQKSIPLLEIMAEVLAMPVEDFISKFAIVRSADDTSSSKLLSSLDKAAKTTIYEVFRAVREADLEQGEGDIIVNVLKSTVLSQMSAPGYLHVTSVDKAICSIRDNLYIAGLSASKYPGSPSQDYLLLDCDIDLFGDKVQCYRSKERIKKKSDAVVSLAELASDLGSKIHISYAGMNVSELKQDNASSLVYELFSKTGGPADLKSFNKAITKVKFFEPALSASRLVGQAYIEGDNITPIESELSEVKAKCSLEKRYSPSALEMFWGCPRKFMLQYVLGLNQLDDYDPFAVISAADRGTLAHSVMEQLANSTMTLEEFLKVAGEFFDRYIAEHPVLMPEKIPAERRLFMDMMEIAYNRDPHRKVVLKEKDIECTHETGVKLHGFPDRIEMLDDGTYLVVDYKTGGEVKHKEDDINTCLQVVIYAYLMEHMGYKISGCEYRYIRIGEEVRCKYDDEIKEKLTVVLEKFKEMMTKSYFPCGNACDFCKFGKVCGVENIEIAENLWTGESVWEE